jgi:hypothetical protein
MQLFIAMQTLEPDPVNTGVGIGQQSSSRRTPGLFHFSSNEREP